MKAKLLQDYNLAMSLFEETLEKEGDVEVPGVLVSDMITMLKLIKDLTDDIDSSDKLHENSVKVLRMATNKIKEYEALIASAPQMDGILEIVDRDKFSHQYFEWYNSDAVKAVRDKVKK